MTDNHVIAIMGSYPKIIYLRNIEINLVKILIINNYWSKSKFIWRNYYEATKNKGITG